MDLLERIPFRRVLTKFVSCVELFRMNSVVLRLLHGATRPSCKAALHINEFFVKENSQSKEVSFRENSLRNRIHCHRLDNHLHSIDIAWYNTPMDIRINYDSPHHQQAREEMEFYLAFGFEGSEVTVALSNVIRQTSGMKS